MMNTLKKAAIGAGIALTTMFAAGKDAEAQIVASSSNAPATTSLSSNFSNTDKEPAKNSALEPAIREGHFGTAVKHSGQNKMMVIQIAGSSVEQLKIEAQKLHAAFKNSAIPTDVVVFYEQQEIPQPLGGVLMNGHTFKLPSGADIFDLPTLEKHANTLTKYYHIHHAPTAQATGDVSAYANQGLAVNNP